MSAELVVLGKFKYAKGDMWRGGPLRESADTIVQALDRRYLEHPGPIQLTEEDRALTETLIANHSGWVEQHLGLSVRNRVPRLDKIGIYDPKDEASKEIIAAYGLEVQASGLHNPLTGEIVLVPASHIGKGHDLGHEITHTFSAVTIGLDREYKIKPSLDALIRGFRGSRDMLSFFDESFIEMGNIEMLDHLRQTGGEDFLTGFESAYIHGVMFLDSILGIIAEESGWSKRNLRNGFYMANMLGQMQALRTFTSFFGKDFLRNLSHSIVYSLPYLRDGIESFGLDGDRFEEQVLTYANGGEIEVLDGVKIKGLI